MAQRIGSLVPGILKQTAARRGALLEVQQRWRRLVGRNLAAHSKPVSLRRGRLVVHVDRPGENFALNYQRTTLLRQLHGETQGRVQELVIRAGEV